MRIGVRRHQTVSAVALGAILVLAACTTSTRTESPGANYRTLEPEPAAFELCFNHGCIDRAVIRLEEHQWAQVRARFMPSPASAAEERLRIAEAVALLEAMTGEQAGTSADIGGTFAGFLHDKQLDCIDESINTSTYLILLRQAGLLRWHVLANPASRGYFLLGWPHATAVVVETETAKAYAVDSWFHDNGHPPAVVPLYDWYRGWSPDDV